MSYKLKKNKNVKMVLKTPLFPEEMKLANVFLFLLRKYFFPMQMGNQKIYSNAF